MTKKVSESKGGVFALWCVFSTFVSIYFLSDGSIVFFDFYRVPEIRQSDPNFIKFINSANSNIILCTLGTFIISIFYYLNNRKTAGTAIDLPYWPLILCFIIFLGPIFNFYIEAENMYPLYSGRGSIGTLIGSTMPSFAIIYLAIVHTAKYVD